MVLVKLRRGSRVLTATCSDTGQPVILKQYACSQCGRRQQKYIASEIEVLRKLAALRCATRAGPPSTHCYTVAVSGLQAPTHPPTA